MRTTVALFSLTLLAGCSNVDPGVGDSDEAITGELLPTGKGYLTRNANAQANAGGGAGAKTGANGINYHGGPVMLGTVNIYYIWYGNWAGNSATTILPDLVGDLNGSGYEHINTTYSDGSNNHVSGNLALAGQTTVSAYLGTSLTDAQIFQVVTDTPAKGTFPSDSSAIYFVLTSADVTASSGFCTQYCGWHTHGANGGKDIKYAFVGNPDRCPSSCAEQTTGPNGNAGADGMASIIAHESEEAISDPDLNAWYDRRGNENADKCAWTFGTESTAANGAKYNFSGTRQWLIQQNWVNAGGGFCAMSY
jgi:hypothetical protein